jgi:hypothetical protein
MNALVWVETKKKLYLLKNLGRESSRKISNKYWLILFPATVLAYIYAIGKLCVYNIDVDRP